MVLISAERAEKGTALPMSTFWLMTVIVVDFFAIKSSPLGTVR
jgi:hypothetical protein